MCFVNTWEVEQAKRIGRAVKVLREPRTGQWLANRTAELGMKMTRQTVTDLENGRRRYVTTAELTVLAAALNVAPIVLLYPGPDYGEYIEVLPNVSDRKISAVQWFSGIRDHGYSDASGAEQASVRAEYRENIKHLELWRELVETQRKISSITLPTRLVDGELVRGELTDVQRAQLDVWNDHIRFVRGQLGLGEDSNGG
jgi:transcriptional regulator with XRE-family HTH domain